MSTYEEKQELANGFSWDEILSTRGFAKLTLDDALGNEVDWEALNGDRFRTFGETEHLFNVNNGSLVFKPGPVTKFDAIRLLHFGGDGSLANEFLLGGSPLNPTALDAIAFEINEERARRMGLLDPATRYQVDMAFRTKVDSDRLRQEASSEAKRQIAESTFNSSKKTPKATLLSEFLEMEFEKERYLVDGLIPTNSTVTLVAARKTGKSTFVYNLIYSLLFGKPLLNVFATKSIQERIGYVNYELTKEQAQEWFARTPIGSTDQVAVWNLRGEPNPFRNSDATSVFAKEVKDLGIRVLILDPFSSAYRGDSLDNDAVKAFFLMTDAFKEESGVRELIIPIHAGWDSSRVRGASTLDDHPDAILHLQSSKDGTRTFHAFGRDVDVAQGELEFDKETLLLTYKGALTPDYKIDKLVKAIIDLLRKKTEVNSTELRTEIVGSNHQIETARKKALADGLISCRQEGNAKKYSLTAKGLALSPEPALGMSARGKDVLSPPIYRGDTTASTHPTICGCGKPFGDPTPLLGLIIEVCWDCFDVGNVTGELIESSHRVSDDDWDNLN